MTAPEVKNRYAIIQADSTEMLGIYVNETMNNGWTPQGGVFASFDSSKGFCVYLQAVVFPAVKE